MTDELLTVTEAARRLNVTRKTVYDWSRGKDKKLRRHKDGRVPAEEVERLMAEWRAERKTAERAVEVADYLMDWYKREESEARAAFVEACRKVAEATGPKAESDALVAVQVAGDHYRAVAAILPVVTGAVDGATELARETMGLPEEGT